MFTVSGTPSGFLPVRGAFGTFIMHPAPAPRMLGFRFLGAPRPDVFPAPFRGVNPAGCPSCQTETEGRNPGNPEPVHPSRIILSTGLAYRLQGKEPAPGHGFRGTRCRMPLCASRGFLPAPVDPCFRFPGNGCRGTCIRGGCFSV